MTTPLHPTPDHDEDGLEPKKRKRVDEPDAKPLSDKTSSPLFKIAPADPKNAFDFEDVADK